MKFSRLGLGLVALAALAIAATGVAQSGSGSATPAGPAVVAQLGSTPAPTPSGRPRRGRRGGSTDASPSPGPSATESAPPLQFSSLDGIWEVEAQPIAKRTLYSHLSLAQNGNQLTGYWEHEPNKTRSSLTGTFDGRLFNLSIDLGAGKSATMAGYSENFSDFVGLLRTAPNDQGLPFTAQHRKKERPT